MPSTPLWINVAEGLLMEYEKEVAEKVWRGKRSGAVSPGYGGGVYPTRSRSGRRGHNWKESQKNHNPEISVQKNANINGKHRNCLLLSKKGKFANVKKLFIGRKVVTCLLFVS
ncbi:hypothetical protein VPH35_056123 [Triticum aestivum]